MDDSQLDERAPSAGPVQQVVLNLVPVSRTQSVAAFFAAQTGGAAAAAAADFFAANNIDAVPVARTAPLPATQLSGALACRCPLSRSLTDKGRAGVLNLLADISEHHANNHNTASFSNYSRLPPTPEADAVSVEVIFCVCFFYNKF